MDVTGSSMFGSVTTNSQAVSQNSAKSSNNVNYFDSHNPLASIAYMQARNKSFPDDNVGNKLDFLG